MTWHPAPAEASAAEPESAFDVAAYLARIDYHDQTRPSLATLAGLHLAHLRTVPFENLDIVRFRRPISLQLDDLFEKVVHRRRGGFCFELNGVFAALLRQLGFSVTLLAASFPRPPGEIAPELDHLALVVDTAIGEGPWLADVGAGRGSSATPLRVVPSQPQYDPITRVWFRLEPEGDGLRLLRRDPAGPAPDAWERQYLIAPRPRRLDEFAAGAHYHQTSASSPFTRGLICSMLTPTGRVTLSERRLISTSTGQRHERLLGDDELRAVLRDQFGIAIEIASTVVIGAP